MGSVRRAVGGRPYRPGVFRRQRRRRLLFCALVLSGCASTAIRQQDQAELMRAERLTSQGCYDCLTEARDIYARLAVGRARPLLVSRLFETELILALREKELAIDSGETERRAAALVDELTSAADARRVLDMADLVPPEREGTPHRVLVERSSTGARGETVRGLEADVAWLEKADLDPLVRTYLRLSIVCNFRRTGRLSDDATRLVETTLDPTSEAEPLLRYRAATCEGVRATALTALLVDEPRFLEAHYFLARLGVSTVQQRGNVADVRAPLEAAYARFPHSPAVTHLYGQFHQLIGDCKAGLRFYDETLAIWPGHENGMLGRTVCLTFLSHHDDAIRAASRMIALPTDNRVEAYYWRAWNYWHLEQLAEARADIEAAKALRSNGEIHTLAGQIEHDQDDFGPAEKDLRTARSLSFGEANCTAAWYLGLVLMKGERWRETAETFEGAMGCYENRVAESEAGLARIRANRDLDPEFRTRQVTSFEAAIKEDRGQYHAAAFNAANHFVRAGDVERARPLIEIAARDPALADLVRQLREYIKRGGQVRGAPARAR